MLPLERFAATKRTRVPVGSAPPVPIPPTPVVDCALELVVVPAPPAPVLDEAAVDPLLAALLVAPEVEVALESPDPPHAKSEAQARSSQLEPNDASIRLRTVGRDYHFASI